MAVALFSLEQGEPLHTLSPFLALAAKTTVAVAEEKVYMQHTHPLHQLITHPAFTLSHFTLSHCSPTPLDAAVYGHLSAIRHCVPGTWVKESAPGLVRFYVELRGRYFAGGAGESSSNPFDAEDRRLDKKRLEEGSTEGEAFFALRFATGLQAGTSPETEQLVKIGVTACILGVTGVMVWAFVTKRGSGGR